MSEKYISKENLGLVVDGLKTEIENDWNENDKNKTGYIKNRTHWEEREYVTFVDNFDSSADTASPKCNFSIGEKYDVTWNGVLYEGLVCYYDGEYNCIGGDGYPFHIDDDGGNNFYAFDMEDETKNYVVSVSGYVNNIHQLDIKFIPQTIQRKINGKRNQIICFDNNANITALDRFDYGYSTSGKAPDYTVTINGITKLEKGLNFTIIPHTYSSSAKPTLNLNGLGAKPIRRCDSGGTDVIYDKLNWLGTNPVHVIYDGSVWIASLATLPRAYDLEGTVSIQNGGTGATAISQIKDNLSIENGMILINTEAVIPSSLSWQSIAYGSDKFVALSGGKDIAYSIDGINWTVKTAFRSSGWSCITYGKDKFVAVNSSSDSNLTAYSIDGINWNYVSAPDTYSSVTYCNNKFIALNGSSTIAYSDYGADWATMTVPCEYCTRAVYGNNKYIIMSDDGTAAFAGYLSSSTSWTKITIPMHGTSWCSVAYGGGKFIAVSGSAGSNSTKVSYSNNGTNWTTSTLPVEANWGSVVYGNGKFIIGSVGKDNSIVYSIDGITWTATTSPIAGGLFSIVYGNNKFVSPIYGSKSAIFSFDGINWCNKFNGIIQNGADVTSDTLEALAHTHDEYIPSPATATVGQTIRVKTVDENNLPTEWEAVDAQVDWDEVTNKPFVKVGGDTLTWDGNTEGLANVDGMHFKVSDAVLTKADIANGCSFIMGGTTVSLTGEEAQSGWLDDGLGTLSEGIVIVPYDNYTDEYGTIEEKGVYLLNIDGDYVSSLTIPNYTGFAKEQIDPKVLPEALQFGETTVASDTLEWDGNTEGLVSDNNGIAYKVSDAVFSAEDCANGVEATLNIGTGECTVVDMGGVTMIIVDGEMGAAYSVPAECVGVDFDGIAFPKAGVYFANIPDVYYCTSLTIPNYTGFTKTEIKQIEEKFIPDTVPTIQSATVGQTIRVSAVDENGVPTAWEAFDPFVLTDESTGTKYKLTVVDSKLTMTEVTV
jgi:hypothetical protein